MEANEHYMLLNIVELPALGGHIDQCLNMDCNQYTLVTTHAGIAIAPNVRGTNVSSGYSHAKAN